MGHAHLPELHDHVLNPPISGNDVVLMEKILEMLNDVEGVQNIYHDVEY